MGYSLQRPLTLTFFNVLILLILNPAFRASSPFSLEMRKQSDRMPQQSLLSCLLSIREHRRSWSILVLTPNWLQWRELR